MNPSGVRLDGLKILWCAGHGSIYLCQGLSVVLMLAAMFLEHHGAGPTQKSLFYLNRWPRRTSVSTVD